MTPLQRISYFLLLSPHHRRELEEAMDPDGWAKVERCPVIAEKLLTVRDFVGSKRFAERAMEADPLIDDILIVTNVLLASQCRVNNYVDWYAILQLSASPDPSAIKLAYRCLTRNPLPRCGCRLPLRFRCPLRPLQEVPLRCQDPHRCLRRRRRPHGCRLLDSMHILLPSPPVRPRLELLRPLPHLSPSFQHRRYCRSASYCP
ncbi:uncharacterized protein [Elaeis guineensis]|uniref:uncharacterized protein n=1 Tax=Elaeis guineensis var. tenera TaxID=51953 RepID=UPI003C6D0839